MYNLRNNQVYSTVLDDLIVDLRKSCNLFMQHHRSYLESKKKNIDQKALMIEYRQECLNIYRQIYNHCRAIGRQNVAARVANILKDVGVMQ